MTESSESREEQAPQAEGGAPSPSAPETSNGGAHASPQNEPGSMESPKPETSESSTGESASGAPSGQTPDTPQQTSQGGDVSSGEEAPAQAGGEPSSGPDPDAAQGGDPSSGPDADAAQTGGASDDQAEASAAASGEQPAGQESGAGEQGGSKSKKRRRRRRKKNKAAAAEGEAAKGERKEGSQLPFLQFFEGSAANKRHAFAPGEIVAGRVERVEDGAFVVDLFGKAKAVVDDREPHEIPVAPPEETQQTAEAAQSPEPQGAQAGSEGAQPQDATAEQPAQATESGATGGTEAESAPSGEQAAQAAQDQGSVVVSKTVTVSDHPPAAAESQSETAGGADEASGSSESSAVQAPAEHGQSESQATEAPAEGTTEAAGDSASTSPAASAGEPAEPESQATAQSGPTEQADASHLNEQPLPEPDSELAGSPQPPSVGAIFRGRVGAVAESGHIAIINRNIDRNAAKQAVARAREEKQHVQGLVYGFNRGGFDVIVQGIRAFCPASGMSLETIENPEPFLGRRYEFSLPANKGGSGIVVSRRNILEKEQRKRLKQRMKELEPGQRLQGTVTHVREFGVFVDLGEGLEGLVHQSELSWQRGVRPADVAKPGDSVEVQVLEVKPVRRKERHGKISLSMRALQPDPWDQHADVLQEGSVQKGKVVSTTDFGAFVELAPGIEGLLHISELGRELKHAKEAVSAGEEMQVVIERVDRENRRISLSRLSPVEAELLQSGEFDSSKRPKSLKPGNYASVLVDRVEHAGVQVRVQGVLGKRGRGFIPNRELQGEDGPIDRKSLSSGSQLDVKIIGTEKGGQLRCSTRAKLIDEERKAVQDYRKEASKKGLGTFGDLLRAKLQGVLNEDDGGDDQSSGTG